MLLFCILSIAENSVRYMHVSKSFFTSDQYVSSIPAAHILILPISSGQSFSYASLTHRLGRTLMLGPTSKNFIFPRRFWWIANSRVSIPDNTRLVSLMVVLGL